MPTYTYRREDGTTFEVQQKFSDDPLQVDPQTGQQVTRVIHAAGIVFKGSGFYVNDSKGSKANLSTPAASTTEGGETKSETKPETKTKSETKAETPAAKGSDAAD